MKNLALLTVFNRLRLNDDCW